MYPRLFFANPRVDAIDRSGGKNARISLEDVLIHFPRGGYVFGCNADSNRQRALRFSPWVMAHTIEVT